VITEKQLKMLWALARQAGLEDEGLHEAVKGLTGKDSIKTLTQADLSRVIERLKQAGARIKKNRIMPRDLPINTVEIITAKQRGLIKYFEEKLEWHDNPDRLKGLSKRIIKKEAASTKAEGIKMILALRQMANKHSLKTPAKACQ